MVALAQHPVGVYVMTVWWHSRGDSVANAELVDILTAQGFLDDPHEGGAGLDAIDAAVRAASADEATRVLLAQWCEKTEQRRDSSGVMHPAHWLPRVTASAATATDPVAAQREHQMVMEMIARLPATDAADPAIAQAIMEYFQAYSARREHWGPTPAAPSPPLDQP